MKHITYILLVLGTSLSACSTSQVALDQANHGAALTASLHNELRGFQQTQVSIAASRIETLKEIERRLADYRRSSGFNDRIARLAQRNDAARLYESLSGLADSIATDEADYQVRLGEMDERFNSLLKPLPESATKLAAVQKALASLGAELSPSQRIQLITGFAKELKSEFEKSKEAAEKAVQPKQAPVQAAP